MTRARIISEIKRMAAANAGRPPGVKAFEDETGTPRRSWLGKYWARWSDALAEAGFEANTLNPKTSDEEILEHLARFILELKRWPTNAELELRRRGDSLFPSHNVFTRIGKKHQLATRLRAYCESRPEFASIVQVCDDTISSAASPRVEPLPGVEIVGYVYLIKYGKHYKLGRTNSTARRHREVQLELPNDTRLIHSIETDDPSGIEAYWHRRFAERRHKGEWFALKPEDVAAFRRRRFQ